MRRIEGIEEEAYDKNWDQCKEKVSIILKSKLKINNVKIDRTHRIPRRKRIHNKDKPRSMLTVCSYHVTYVF